ncbi:hypothetical protein ACHAXA_010976 [Cyclostephanos tholiformis]|uniref:Nuclear transport factor 2 n=1 Tax=Cyclostephanos tholiformis TaxID=382380 RepID=A0ABD3RZX9_9STRA
MSGNQSPSPSPLSPPGVGGGPTPQQIGSAFIKQYYKTLLAAPSQLNRFYQTDSTISRGMEPSAPATPSSFSLASSVVMNSGEESMGERVQKAFFDWASVKGDVDSLDALTVDFERGAIDAQESIGGGILLVVTGHMSLPGRAKPSGFVHTFFLNNAAAPGRKKQFLVKNDILRFLEPVSAEVEEIDEEYVQAEETTLVVPEIESASPVVDEPILVSSPAINPIPLEPVEYEPSADEEKVEEDDEDIEEPLKVEKIDVTESSYADSDSSPTASPSSDGKKVKRSRKKKGGKSSSRSNSPATEEDVKEEAPEKPKAPGSWASLVASGGAPKNFEVSKKGRKGSPKASRGGGSDKLSSVNQGLTKAPALSQPANEAIPAATIPTAAPPQANQSQRTAGATLFIRNVPDKTQESEIRALFEAQGLAHGNKILGITLNSNRGFCFVDFDGPGAVLAIVEEATTSLVKDQRTGRRIESAFMVHGRVLEVEQKVIGGKTSGGGGGDRGSGSGGGGSGSGGRKYNRSKSPKNGGDGEAKHRGSRGGSGVRRSEPQRGEGGGKR